MNLMDSQIYLSRAKSLLLIDFLLLSADWRPVAPLETPPVEQRRRRQESERKLLESFESVVGLYVENNLHCYLLKHEKRDSFPSSGREHMWSDSSVRRDDGWQYVQVCIVAVAWGKVDLASSRRWVGWWCGVVVWGTISSGARSPGYGYRYECIVYACGCSDKVHASGTIRRLGKQQRRVDDQGKQVGANARVAGSYGFGTKWNYFWYSATSTFGLFSST